MTQPFSVEAFNAYKTAIAAALREHVTAAVRGACVAYSDRRVSTRVVVYHEGPAEPIGPTARQALAEALASLPAACGMASGPPELVFERCDPPAPLSNLGCPIYGRADATWRLPPEVQAQLDAGALRRVAG